MTSITLFFSLICVALKALQITHFIERAACTLTTQQMPYLSQTVFHSRCVSVITGISPLPKMPQRCRFSIFVLETRYNSSSLDKRDKFGDIRPLAKLRASGSSPVLHGSASLRLTSLFARCPGDDRAWTGIEPALWGPLDPVDKDVCLYPLDHHGLCLRGRIYIYLKAFME